MKKVINIETSDNNVVRVLSIMEPEIKQYSPNGFSYIMIDDYTEPPMVDDATLDINYPMYDKDLHKFFWVTVNYQKTATEQIIFEQNILKEIKLLKDKMNLLQKEMKKINILQDISEERAVK